MPKAPKGGGRLKKIEVNLKLTDEQREKLLKTLQDRFEENMNRHKSLSWPKVQEKLKKNSQKLASLNAMEETGGEPDVVGFDKKSGEFIFYDCSPESPAGRRSICYDQKAEQERVKKGVHPAGSAIELAEDMGVELLTEEQYRELQELGEFDLKTSSWIDTPAAIRNLGGALFCDRRYDQIFTYHNGAPSFYAARGFRGILRV